MFGSFVFCRAPFLVFFCVALLPFGVPHWDPLVSHYFPLLSVNGFLLLSRLVRVITPTPLLHTDPPRSKFLLWRFVEAVLLESPYGL